MGFRRRDWRAPPWQGLCLLLPLLVGLLSGSFPLMRLCWKRQEPTPHANILKFPGVLFHAIAIVGMCLPSKVQQITTWSNGHRHMIVVASFPICSIVIPWPTTWLPPWCIKPPASFRLCYCKRGHRSYSKLYVLACIKTKCTLVSLSWRDLLRICISYRIKGRIKEKGSRLS